jgi:hypothetical protein
VAGIINQKTISPEKYKVLEGNLLLKKKFLIKNTKVKQQIQET